MVAASHLLWVSQLWRVVVSNEAHGLHGAVVEIRWLSVHHLYHHDPQRPHVNLQTQNGWMKR